MAKKGSPGGLGIVGFIILAMMLKYWHAFLAIGFVCLVIWIISRLFTNSGTTSYSTRSYVPPPSPPPKPQQSTSQKPTSQKPTPQAPALNVEFRSTLSPYRSSASQPRPAVQDLPAREPSYQNYRPDLTIYGASVKPVDPDSLWVPKGKTVQVHGYTIPGGFIYVGTGLLKTFSGWGVEPAQIDPALPVDERNPDRSGEYMDYWPSYSKISPSSRAAFLEWAASDRNDPSACIGYVFIYFYGLERRALGDAKSSSAARAELDSLVAEAKRLLSVYGHNRSFNGYCSRFIDMIETSGAREKLYLKSPIYYLPTNEIPLSVSLGLGQMAAIGMSLPADWAVAWVLTDPFTPRRTPYHRCREEFTKLFTIKYMQKYGETGCRLKANKTKLKFSYRPASSSFGGVIDVSIEDVPDITILKEPITTLRMLAESCANDLEPYSRYLGRKNSGRDSIEGAMLLPPDLLSLHDGKEYRILSAWLRERVISDAPVRADLSMLLSILPSIAKDSFGKREATTLVQVLEKMGFGIEPDPRFGSFLPKAGRDVILFKTGSQAPDTPSSAYSAATILLHLASAVAHADGSVCPEEEQHLEEHLESLLHLSAAERVRLKAHAQWLIRCFPGLNGLKKRLETLNQQQKESIGRFLVGVANADGYIDPNEIKILTKIYDLLGLDPQNVYSHAHAAAVEPVTVQVPDVVKPGFAIPSPPQQAASEGVVLNMQAIEAKMAETVAVSALLKDIFVEEDAEKVDVVAVNESPADSETIAGLDSDISAFMRVLASKLMWKREELEKLAADHSLMLDGTLDSINDASFDFFGGPFFEGEDPIEINAEYAKEIAA